MHGPVPDRNDDQYIRLKPVSFDSGSRTRAGRLEFLRGWRLESDNADFGGVSSMLALPDNRFIMLSDAGVLIGFTLSQQDGDGESGTAKRPFIAPLPDGPRPESQFAKKNWDAESIVHDPETGQYWVGFEHAHSIWRYGPSFARKEAAHKVKAMQDWPLNGGAEAMLHIAGKAGEQGRFLVFSESADFAEGAYQALIFDSDPAEESAAKLFGYRPPKGYVITDAALLPDGRAVLLHRRFRPLEGISAIVSIGDPAKITPGEVWSGEPIATLKSPMRVDNMEAIAATVEGDDTIIWIASDDNFNLFQETLLMKFRLLPVKKKRKSQASRKKPKAEARPGFSVISK